VVLKIKCYSSVFVAYYVNELGGSMHTVKKITETLLSTNNETVLEVNAEKTTCIKLPRDQNSGLINVVTLHTFENSPNTSELHA